MDLKILHKDEYFVVVDKNPDTIINSTDNNRVSLHNLLTHKYPEDVNSQLKFGFYFPHRLDFSTSGVMCVALTKDACAAASAAFQNRTSGKFYLALVRGHVSQIHLQINIPIGDEENQNIKDEKTPIRKMSANGIRTRHAVSRMLVLDRGIYCSYPATKVLLKPLTGRRHQLRVHCHHIGHTIVGDYTYSNRKDVEPPRMFLHSYRLVLPNRLRNLDIETVDPFNPNLVEHWTPVEVCNQLGAETMEIMDETTVWNNINSFQVS